MTALYIALGIVFLFLVFEFCAAVYFFGFAIKPHPFDLDETVKKYPNHDFSELVNRINTAKEKLPAYSSDELTLTSGDGLKLYGRYYRSESPRGICIIMCHGYNNNGFCEFGHAALFYLEHGCDVLLIDQRACGKSEGKYITFGVKESGDVAKWCGLIAKTYSPEHIILHGISLGGATVMMTAGETLPDSVHGIIEDCGFTFAYEQFRHILKVQYKLAPCIILPATNLYCRAVAKFGFKDKNCAEIMKSNKLPALFIHGDRDNYVPFRMAKEIYDAAVCEKEYFPVEGAKHAEAFIVDGDGCTDACARLIKKATGIDIYE